MEHVLLGMRWSRPREDMVVDGGSQAGFFTGKWHLPNLPVCCCGSTGLGTRGEQWGSFIMTLRGLSGTWFPTVSSLAE